MPHQIAQELGVPPSVISENTAELRAWIIAAALENNDLPPSLRQALEQRPEARAQQGD